MKIAIDAMGGDFAPENIVKGVNLAKKELSDVTFQLYGDGAKIRQFLDDETAIEIIETTEVIDFHDDPVAAIKSKKRQFTRSGSDCCEKKGKPMLSFLRAQRAPF